MAYVDSSLLDENQNEDQAGGPVTPGGAPSATTQSTTAPNATPTGSQKKNPGNFADLSEYLRVNQPQEFGTKVAGKIGDDITKGQNTLSNAEGEFKNRADAATVTDNQNLIGQVGESPETVDKTAFTGLRDAEYKGPTNFSDTQDLYSQATGNAGAAVGKANASKTEGGRFALLDSYFGKPSYSQGQKSLDNLLVQGDKNGKEAFAQMQQNANALQQNVNTTGERLGEYGAGAAQKTKDTRTAARNALGIDEAGNLVEGAGAIGSAQKGIADQFASRQAAQAADDTAIREALASGDLSKLTPEQRADLGDFANMNSGSTYGVDPTKYLTKAQLTAQNTQTAEQQKRLAALGSLAGRDDLGAPIGENDVGKYATDSGVGINFDELNNAIGGQRQAYQAEIAQVQQQAKPAIDKLQETINGITNIYNKTLEFSPGKAEAMRFNGENGGPSLGNYQQTMAYYQNRIAEEQAKQRDAARAIDVKYGVNGAANAAARPSGANYGGQSNVPVVRA